MDRRCTDHAPLIMHHHSPSRLAHACDLEYPRKRNRAAAGRRRPRRRRPDAPPTRTNRWRAPARARTAVLGRHAHLLPAARGRLMPRCRCWSGRAGRWRLGRPLHASSRSLERPLVGKSWGDALRGSSGPLSGVRPSYTQKRLNNRERPGRRVLPI